MAASRTALAEWRSYGYLPFVAALGYATCVLHVYSFGPFIEPLQQEFGWSRARISAGLTVAALISAAFCIPVGMLIDRVGPRRVGLVGVLLMSGSVALLGTATGSHANWLALWGVVAIGTFFVQATVWTTAVASRFEASRGLAFAVTLSGASFAAAAFPVFTAWSIGAYGWRTAFAALGGTWAALVFPILLLLFRGAQDQRRKASATAQVVTLSGLTLAEAARTSTLYKLLAASGLFAFTAIGVLVHFVPILTDSGATPMQAAGTASLIGLFSIIGRLGTGVLLDRLPASWVGAGAFLIPIVACVLLLLEGAHPLSQALAAASIGLTVGAEVDVVAYLTARHFGLKNYGALYGALAMALGLGTAFGPLAAGAVFDQSGSYAPFLVLTIVLMGVAAVALLSLGATPKAAGAVAPAS